MRGNKRCVGSTTAFIIRASMSSSLSEREEEMRDKGALLMFPGSEGCSWNALPMCKPSQSHCSCKHRTTASSTLLSAALESFFFLPRFEMDYSSEEDEAPAVPAGNRKRKAMEDGASAPKRRRLDGSAEDITDILLQYVQWHENSSFTACSGPNSSVALLPSVVCNCQWPAGAGATPRTAGCQGPGAGRLAGAAGQDCRVARRRPRAALPAPLHQLVSPLIHVF